MCYFQSDFLISISTPFSNIIIVIIMETSNIKTGCGRFSSIIYWLFLIIILLLAIYIRTRILEIPLERDEGEYAYCGQLLLQMVPPFKAIYTMKLPGTCFAYSLIMLLFGQTIKGIHLGLLLVNCFSIILLFLITRKLLTPRAALVAALSFAILASSPTVLGFAAHATHFVVLAALAGAWLLLSARESGRLALYGGSGFLFGLAFLMKQQGLFFGLWGAFFIGYTGLALKTADLRATGKRLSMFAAGAMLPFLAVAGIALASGTFDKFWFWTVKYSATYAAAVPFSRGVKNLEETFLEVINGFAPLWILAAAGLPTLVGDRRFKDIKWPLITFTLLSFCAVGAGLHFRNHYFILLLPAVAILIGGSIDSLQCYLSQKCSNKFIIALPLLFFISVMLLGINAHRDYFLLEKPETLVKTIHGPNPFLESVKIAAFLKSRTQNGDKIAVLGSEPEIFFYAQRKSATGYIYAYELMANHAYSLSMQSEMIAEIERASPKYLVFIQIIYSWLIQPDSPRLILHWFHDYSRKYYDLAGRVDIISPQETRYRWGDEAHARKDEAPFSILIYHRRQASP